MDNISPIDGRYRAQVETIRQLGFTESRLILTKARVELKWLVHLAELLARLPTPEVVLSKGGLAILQKLLITLQDRTDFKDRFVARVQEIEAEVQHDTKAVELGLREVLAQFDELRAVSELTHIGLTSEDVTGASYALMFHAVYEGALRPDALQLAKGLFGLAEETKASPILSLTHGQPAIPTTFGKEISVFLYRLNTAQFGGSFGELAGTQPHIKFGGAVGTHAAIAATFPGVRWLTEADLFVRSLAKDSGSNEAVFSLDLCTTQIPNREWMLLKLRSIGAQNRVLLDLVKDMWLYVSRGILTQRVVAAEVGSSTMPHKVNPIKFENAEGNLVIANSMIDLLCDKLSESRLQRDLSDSTVIRNIGVALSHTLIAYRSLTQGLSRIALAEAVAVAEIDRHPEVLAEAVQSILRKYPTTFPDPYSSLKKLTRDSDSQKDAEGRGRALNEFIQSLQYQISADDFARLSIELAAPHQYIGLSVEIAEKVLEIWRPLLVAGANTPHPPGF